VQNCRRGSARDTLRAEASIIFSCRGLSAKRRNVFRTYFLPREDLEKNTPSSCLRRVAFRPSQITRVAVRRPWCVPLAEPRTCAACIHSYRISMRPAKYAPRSCVRRVRKWRHATLVVPCDRSPSLYCAMGCAAFAGSWFMLLLCCTYCTSPSVRI
jgi:hypothetical protein